jgi:hypothetical protein
MVGIVRVHKEEHEEKRAILMGPHKGDRQLNHLVGRRQAAPVTHRVCIEGKATAQPIGAAGIAVAVVIITYLVGMWIGTII